MKKIIFSLLVAFVALSFMGCPTVYDDSVPYGIKDPDWIHNWTPEVNGGSAFKLPAYSVTADGYSTKFELPALDSYECCLTIANAAGDGATWEVQYGGEVPADGKFHNLSIGGNLKFVDIGGVTSTVVLKVEGTTVSAKLVK